MRLGRHRWATDIFLKIGGPAMPIGRYFRAVLIALPFASALGVFADWQHDNALLHHQAIKITKNLNTDSRRIRAINDWVYQNKGFGKNNHYFIVPALGPTPIQVLEFGGDCSDKSRLVAAMLNELNLDAGLVMVSSCPNCGFIHTVVEAQYERGRMVVDPIWDVDYPTTDDRFLGVRDLAGTSLGREHVAELQKERGAADKIAAMPA
ncbi:MAG: transglutaminase domain-containing protein, partial [Alphaproteobacteria bacterium]|nr:transglutaminase domain-containing protein [Alphaproteobacteria bacterium]